MADKIQNASRLPKRYFGMHFYDGIVAYPEKNERVYLNEQTLVEMDPTFEGRPVYVGHVEDVDLTNIQRDADGYVVKSFVNVADGKHWVEFLVVSDRGHDAINRGWRLSNAYEVDSYGAGGKWNAIEYQREITKGHYNHLAIVSEPRYDESIVLNPTQFAEYNESLMSKRRQYQNSDTGSDKKDRMASIFKLFKKTSLDESQTKEFEAAVVSLPDGKDVTIGELVANALKKNAEPEPSKEAEKPAEAKESKEEKPPGSTEGKPHEAPEMANMDHHVMVNDKPSKLSDVMKEYDCMRNTMSMLAKYHAENSAKEDGGEKDAKAAQAADKTARNADKDGGQKEADAQLAEADKTRKNNFSKLADADKNPPVQVTNVSMLSAIDRGKSRYGSR